MGKLRNGKRFLLTATVIMVVAIVGMLSLNVTEADAKPPTQKTTVFEGECLEPFMIDNSGATSSPCRDGLAYSTYNRTYLDHFYLGGDKEYEITNIHFVMDSDPEDSFIQYYVYFPFTYWGGVDSKFVFKFADALGNDIATYTATDSVILNGQTKAYLEYTDGWKIANHYNFIKNGGSVRLERMEFTL